jgi:RND family efflux transporter MFP subunit
LTAVSESIALQILEGGLGGAQPQQTTDAIGAGMTAFRKKGASKTMRARPSRPSLSIGIFAALAALAVLPGCKDSEVAKTEVRPVRTVVIDPKPIDDDREAVGEIKPRYESDLGFRVAGKVLSRTVDIGDRVKSGEVLARLDEQDFQNKLRSAEADVSSAEAVLTEAQGTEDRQKQLIEKAVTTQANLDAAIKNRRAAEAQLQSAKASLNLAQDQLKYVVLMADFDGIVTAVRAENGQVVNAGQMIVRLAKPNDVDAVFNISESAFRGRTTSDPVRIVVNLLSNPEVETFGELREISPVADPKTRTFQVKVTLDKPPPAMRFGSSVRGRLRETTAPVVVLPGSALSDKGGKPAVWVFDQANSEVKLTPISVSRFEKDRIVVAEGLTKGQIVVTAGVNRLREGQKVRLLDGAAQ